MEYSLRHKLFNAQARWVQSFDRRLIKILWLVSAFILSNIFFFHCKLFSHPLAVFAPELKSERTARSEVDKHEK